MKQVKRIIKKFMANEDDDGCVNVKDNVQLELNKDAYKMKR
jgi:hypothetical protein